MVDNMIISPLEFSINLYDPIVLQNSICKILKVVVELGGDTVDALVHHAVHQAVQLVLGEVEVKPSKHISLSSETSNSI